jgi:hypothetical protein
MAAAGAQRLDVGTVVLHASDKLHVFSIWVFVR